MASTNILSFFGESLMSLHFIPGFFSLNKFDSEIEQRIMWRRETTKQLQQFVVVIYKRAIPMGIVHELNSNRKHSQLGFRSVVECSLRWQRQIKDKVYGRWIWALSYEMYFSNFVNPSWGEWGVLGTLHKWRIMVHKFPTNFHPLLRRTTHV